MALTKCPDHGTRDASGDFTCSKCGATWDYADGSAHPVATRLFRSNAGLSAAYAPDLTTGSGDFYDLTASGRKAGEE